VTRITRLVMKGFKSFGAKAELVFGTGYNCILGPNGAGKSNIMDALCFVLGKGSAKELRVEKASNLIYNGGKTKEPAKTAEVSIYFDNTNKEFPLETPEIKITRIVKESGLGVYKINDERRTRQQVLDLLSAANLDPDGYNIILQGDIVRLVIMSTVERRQIIEEIAGISIYEEKKGKALNELLKVDEKINEAEIILKERESYLKELKKERDQAMKYKDLSDKVNRNKATLTHMKMQKKLEDKANFDEEFTKYDKIVTDYQNEINDLRKQIADRREEITKINKEVEQKGEKEQVAMLKEGEKLKVIIETNKARIGFCENEILRINTRRTQLEATLNELNTKIIELTTEKTVKEQSKATATKLIGEIDVKIEAFRQKNKLEGAADIDKELEEVDKLIDEKQKEIQAIREQQQNLLREKDKLEFQINSFNEKITKVATIEQESMQEIEKLKQKQVEFKKATLELNTLLNEDSSVTVQLANARNRYLSLQEELSKLNAKSAGVSESMGIDIAMKSIMENKNKFGEVYGTVSSLGEVESKFSLALEIAAGQRMKSIVVDNDKTAANCIRHLKENKLGTATFLPINKMKSSSSSDAAIGAILKSNGVHGLALDLIHYEPKFKSVFSYVFSNTLIVDNIEVSRRIGIGTMKMVTLDGDYADVSGAMHGGYRQKTRELKFQEKEVSSALKAAGNEIENTQSVVRSLEKKKLELEDKISRLRELKASLEGEIIKQEKSLHLESDDLSATKKEKSELEKQHEEIDARVMKIQNQVSDANKVLADAKIKKQNLRAQVMQLRNPTLLAELNTFEQKKSQLKEELLNYEGSIRNIIMQVDNILAPEKENVTKIIKQHDKEEEQFKEEILSLREKITVQSKELDEKEKQQKEFFGKFKELFTKRDKLSEETQKIEGKIMDLEQKLRANDQKKNVFSIENARVKAELSTLEEEFTKYQGIELFIAKSEEAIKKDIADFEKMFQNIGSVNMKALEIYDNIEKEYNSLLDKRDKLKEEKEQVLLMMNEIETKKKDLFLKAYEAINTKFQEMFQSISTKGIAFLHLENEKDPLSEGVAIKVRITGKKFLDIRSLSGGEKTLTALAFIFAIQEYEPASFYVFDEVDAALDKHNSEKLSQLVKKYSGKAQYVIISHNEGMISEADTLYGVTMDESNMSKVVSLKV